MKILTIIGSPRKKGNTWRIAERVKEKLLEMDKGIEYETLFLSEYDLKMCTGCFSCFAGGKEKCPLKDDHAILEAKMLEADGIIFAAPTYAMGVPALMKNFIDRFAYTSHRPCHFDKAFLIISTVGGIMGMKQALTQLALLASGGKSLTKLGVSCPPVTMAGFEKKAEKKIGKAAKSFYRSVVSKERHAPGLVDWAYYSSFKAFTGFKSYQKVSPADYEYYKDKKEYFYPVTGHPFRKLGLNLMKGIMRTSMKLMVKE